MADWVRLYFRISSALENSKCIWFSFRSNHSTYYQIAFAEWTSIFPSQTLWDHSLAMKSGSYELNMRILHIQVNCKQFSQIYYCQCVHARVCTFVLWWDTNKTHYPINIRGVRELESNVNHVHLNGSEFCLNVSPQTFFIFSVIKTSDHAIAILENVFISHSSMLNGWFHCLEARSDNK